MSRFITRLDLVGNWVIISNFRDSKLPSLTERNFMQANIDWRECMCHLSCSSLQVPARDSVRNVTILYAHWWREIVRATCTPTYISRPTIVLSEKKRKDATSEDPSLFGEHPPSRGGKRRGGRRRSRGKKTLPTLLAGSADLGSYFADLDLNMEDPTTEVPPL